MAPEPRPGRRSARGRQAGGGSGALANRVAAAATVADGPARGRVVVSASSGRRADVRARAFRERCDTGLARRGTTPRALPQATRSVPPSGRRRPPKMSGRVLQSDIPASDGSVRGLPPPQPPRARQPQAGLQVPVVQWFERCLAVGGRKLAGKLLRGMATFAVPVSASAAALAGARRTSRLKPHTPWPADSQSAAPRQHPASDLPLTRPGPRRAPPGPALYGNVAAGGTHRGFRPEGRARGRVHDKKRDARRARRPSRRRVAARAVTSHEPVVHPRGRFRLTTPVPRRYRSVSRASSRFTQRVES